MNRKLIVIGSKGFIGKHLTASLNPAIYTHHKGSPYLIDLNTPNLKTLPLSTETHAVIAAGCTNINDCNNHPEKNYAINVAGTLRIAKQCTELGLCPILFSTDYVFDGEEGGYTESSPTSPINAYGKQKAELEEGIHDATGGNYLMLRLSKIYSTSIGDDSLLDEMMQTLIQGRTVRAATDQVFCPLHIDDLVAIIQELIDQRITGLINIGGDETLSRYSLALEACENLNISRTCIEPISLDELEGPPRPKKTALNCQKLYETVSIEPRSLRKAISILAADYLNKDFLLN